MYRSRFLDLGTGWMWMVSCTPLPLYPRRKSPSTYWTGGWVDPRAGLDDMEKLKFLTPPRLEFTPLGRPARRQPLYRQRYRGSYSRDSFTLLYLMEHIAVEFCEIRTMCSGNMLSYSSVK
jgi:hypothetical protein